jgi:hypothetical protein
MKITQVELVNKRDRHLVCWLSGWEGEFRLKKGLVVNFDGDGKDVDWEIVKIYGTQRLEDIRRCWNVGGL